MRIIISIFAMKFASFQLCRLLTGNHEINNQVTISTKSDVHHRYFLYLSDLSSIEKAATYLQIGIENVPSLSLIVPIFVYLVKEEETFLVVISKTNSGNRAHRRHYPLKNQLALDNVISVKATLVKYSNKYFILRFNRAQRKNWVKTYLKRNYEQTPNFYINDNDNHLNQLLPIGEILKYSNSSLLYCESKEGCYDNWDKMVKLLYLKQLELLHLGAGIFNPRKSHPLKLIRMRWSHIGGLIRFQSQLKQQDWTS